MAEIFEVQRKWSLDSLKPLIKAKYTYWLERGENKAIAKDLELNCNINHWPRPMDPEWSAHETDLNRVKKAEN